MNPDALEAWMTREAAAAPSLPNGRRLVADLQQIVEARSQYFAVRLQVLTGKRLAGQPWPSAVISHPLKMLSGSTPATLYSLGEADLVLLCSNDSVDSVDDAINRALRLFTNPAPLGYGAPPTAKVTWYDLMRDVDLQALMSAAQANPASGNKRFVQDTLRPITVADLPSIIQRIDRLPIARMIRRSNVLHVRSSGAFVPLFQQIYISIGEFQRTFAPGIDINADPDLFRYLSAIYDNKLISYLIELSRNELTDGAFCINADISLLNSSLFSQFTSTFSDRKDIMFEIDIENILCDIEMYLQFLTQMRSHSIGVVLGGVKPSSLLNLDLTNLDVDLIKVPSPGTTHFDSDTNAPQALERSLDRLGRARVILTGVETDDRLKWALAVGVNRFQGRLVDKLISAVASKGLATSRTSA
jgi:FOG: EAL domain